MTGQFLHILCAEAQRPEIDIAGLFAVGVRSNTLEANI